MFHQLSVYIEALATKYLLQAYTCTEYTRNKQEFVILFSGTVKSTYKFSATRMYCFIYMLLLFPIIKADYVYHLPNMNTFPKNNEISTVQWNETTPIYFNEGNHSDPLGAINKWNDEKKTFPYGKCDVSAIIAARGESLVDKVKEVHWRCINDHIFHLNGTNAIDACNVVDVTTMANALKNFASNYDGKNPAGSDGMHSIATYLRACYYVQFYTGLVGNYSKNTYLVLTIRFAFTSFLNRPNMDSTNHEHCEILEEIVSLISSSNEHLNFAKRLGYLLTDLSSAWKFESTSYDQSNVINAILDSFYRSHGDNKAQENEAYAYYSVNRNIPNSLKLFLDEHYDLVDTMNEYILRNAGTELGRFLKYPFLYSKISSYIKTQLKRYNPNNAIRVWSTLASSAFSYDRKNCAKYKVCNYERDLEELVLPHNKTCTKSFKDTVLIRAENITDEEADIVCERLSFHEYYFHALIKDNWRPVDPDRNYRIEVVVFKNKESYSVNARSIFGIKTNNGGKYIEGNASSATNVARLFCYKYYVNGSQFDIWNLEHEFTHYLDGRYDMMGNYEASDSGKTVWWMEGLAEYASYTATSPTAVRDCKNKKFTLSKIFDTNYEDDTDRVYNYGYLAVWFMFERHRKDVDRILGFFRSGNYDRYRLWLNSIGTRYDKEFSRWCDCIATGATLCSHVDLN